MKLDLSKPYDVNQFNTYAAKLGREQAKVELKKILPPKSVSQNAYLHVCLSLYGIEFGYSLQEVKTDMKRQAGFWYEKNGSKYLKSVSDMDTKEVADLIDYVRNSAGKGGLYIPDAEEYLINKFNIDKEIELNKSQL